MFIIPKVIYIIYFLLCLQLLEHYNFGIIKKFKFDSDSNLKLST